jgi:replicative DNA helicase
MNSRLPPHDVTTEQAVLGSMLRSSDMIDEVRIKLTEDDFFQFSHKVLFRQILNLADRSGVKSVDLVTLSQFCQAEKVVEEIGGWGYVGEIYNSCPSPANAHHYAGIVKQYSIRRQLISAAQVIMSEAYDPADPDELLDQCEQKILQIREARQTNLKTLRDCGGEVLDRADQVCKGQEIGIKTGIFDLDELVLIKPEDFIIIAARPSVGKSIVGGQIATHVAQQGNGGIFFASVEMPAVDIAGRVLSLIGSIDGNVTAGRRAPTQSEGILLAEAFNNLPANFWIDDSSMQGVPEIAAHARRLHHRHGLSLIVVDYLQLLEVHQGKGTRTEALGQVSRGLKRLTRELKVPVIALAQLNRESEGEPQLHHLRECGDFEQDADQVWLAWKDPEYDGSNIVWIKVGKQRGGPTGSVKVFHRKEFMRFDHHAAGFQPVAQPLFGGK